MQIHTSKMTCAEDVNLEEFVMARDELSGADIKVREDLFLSVVSTCLSGSLSLQMKFFAIK